MTRAQWDDDRLTDAQKLERRLQDAVRQIRRDWPEVLDAPSNPTQRIGGRTSSASGILGDHSAPDRVDIRGRVSWSSDHDPGSADIDATTRLMALVRLVQDRLEVHCTRIVRDRLTRPGQKRRTTTAPYRTDVVGMCKFLDTHSQWLSDQDAEEISDITEELEDLAKDVHGVVDPFKRTHHTVGRCRFVVTKAGDHDPNVEVIRFCRGRVEAPLYDTTESTCSRCGLTAPTEWWELVLEVGQNLNEPVTIPALVPILAERLHIDITDRQIRNWARDGKITPFTPPDDDETLPRHRLFIPRLVLDEVARMGKQCANCGRTWHGLGEFCFTCHDVARGRTSRRADEKPAYNVVVAAPKTIHTANYCVIADEHPDARCTLHDMPKAWCYCRVTPA